jgi:hypothetical protein
LETWAQTNLSGSERNQTVVTLTPGIRFNLGATKGVVPSNSGNHILFGPEIPVSEPRPYNVTYRLTYIMTF